MWKVPLLFLNIAMGQPLNTLQTTVTVPRGSSSTVDAMFLYRASRASNDPGWQYHSAWTYVKENPERYARAYDLFAASVGNEPREGASPFSRPQSYEEFRKLLEAQKDSLTTEERLFILSLFGSRLSKGYDSDRPLDASPVPFEQLWANAVAQGESGGVCRDISAFIAEAAKTIGFESVGVHSFVQFSGKRGIGHVAAHYRDPVTGKYYAQNYSSLLDTGATQLADAIDSSTRFFSVFTDVNWIESRPGHVTMYRAEDSRWVDREIRQGVELEPEWSTLAARVSNEERFVMAQHRFGAGRSGAKGFLLHSDQVGKGGRYQVDAIGLSGATGGSAVFKDSALDELAAYASAHLGYMRYINPAYLARGSAEDQNPFAGTRLAGSARFDRWSGQLSMDVRSLEIQPGTFGFTPSGWWNETLLGVFREFPALSGWIGLERGWNVRPDTLVETRWSPHTAWDRVSVVLDGRGKKRRAYLYFKGEAYVLDGVEELSGGAIHGLVKAALPTGSEGELAIVLDASDVVYNPHRDPLLQDLPVADLGPEWTQTFTDFLQTGATVKVGNGRTPAYLFEDPWARAAAAGAVRGSVWIRLRF